DRYALVLAKKLQDTLANEYYPKYAFHLAAQEIVQFCSEELGAFYLDILKDRLYTLPENSHARRSSQTALYHITRALVLMMSPILCFTCDEAWAILTGNEEDSVLYHTAYDFPEITDAEQLTQRWQTLREVRSAVNKEIETLRSHNAVGSSLQAEVEIIAPQEIFELLQKFGEELRFAMIVSSVKVSVGKELQIAVQPSPNKKCVRCWHYTDNVGVDHNHSELCLRCANNLSGKDEKRQWV
ncbi:MAG: class I tRNA ligase family protein, partial [Neisseriaceae bacterium]|nr:class I tRNA ligase family protein [Neisseriaceae bacterium]